MNPWAPVVRVHDFERVIWSSAAAERKATCPRRGGVAALRLVREKNRAPEPPARGTRLQIGGLANATELRYGR